MNVTITSEYNFCATPDGAVWTDGPCHYRFLSRYLTAFERVNVVARATPIDLRPENHLRADGPRVGFSRLPTYHGPWQYLRRRGAIRQAIRDAVGPRDAVILNVPSQLSSCMASTLEAGRPYAVQVLGDPNCMFAPDVIRNPLRPFLRWFFTSCMKKQARQAFAALYVTQKFLQTGYPCPGYMLGLSDVDLPPEAFVSAPRGVLPDSGPVTLITVGAMTQMQKGHDILIDAVAECVQSGLNLRLVMIGDGKHRPEFEERAKCHGIGNVVEFRGQLAAGEPIRAELDAADVFVFPSRTEGLPRALIEAMARGLPCLASDVGGIPELLNDEDLTPRGNVPALARAIRNVVNNRDRCLRMAERNLRRAREFRAEVLEDRRAEFYRHVATRTAEQLRVTPLDLSASPTGMVSSTIPGEAAR